MLTSTLPPTTSQSRWAVVYARVSSKDQEKEGYSIPSQLALLRSYATANGFTIVQEFIDVETAKAAGRSGFGEMIEFLKANDTCRTLLVEKTDRLYRNFKDYVVIDELRVDLHLVKENGIVSPDSRSSEKFMHGIKVLVAKNYIDNLSEESRKGVLQKARQGIWPSCAPLGYSNVVGPDGKRTIVPDPVAAPIIRTMFERYATGKCSLDDILRLAHADGLAYRKSGTPVPKSSLHAILRNRIYSGDFDYDGTTYAGKYEPVVSRELWAEVQQILSGRGAKKTHTVKQAFAFSGFLTCGHCGCAMVGEMKKGRYVYYHCTGAKGKCPEPYTREEILEKEFSEVVKGLRFTSDVLAWAATAMDVTHAEELKSHEDAIARLERERQRVQDRLDCMYVDRLDGRIDMEFFDRNAAKFRFEQEHIAEDIKSHQRAKEGLLQAPARLLELANQAHGLFIDQPAAEKRKLLDVILSGCAWKNGQLAVEYRKPFDRLADSVAA